MIWGLVVVFGGRTLVNGRDLVILRCMYDIVLLCWFNFYQFLLCLGSGVAKDLSGVFIPASLDVFMCLCFFD